MDENTNHRDANLDIALQAVYAIDALTRLVHGSIDRIIKSDGDAEIILREYTGRVGALSSVMLGAFGNGGTRPPDTEMYERVYLRDPNTEEA